MQAQSLTAKSFLEPEPLTTEHPSTNNPPALKQPEMRLKTRTAAEPTFDEPPATQAMYSQMDAQLRPNAGFPDWAKPEELASKILALDSNTLVQDVRCAPGFCRLLVRTAAGLDQQALVDLASGPLAEGGSSLLIRHPTSNADQVFVYMLDPNSSSQRSASEKGFKP